MIRQAKSVLWFRVTQKMNEELDHAIQEIITWNNERDRIPYIDDLQDVIDDKLLDIDMLLTKIDHISKYNQWSIVDIDTEIDRAVKELSKKFDQLNESIDK